MSLRAQAQIDLRTIVENVGDFGWPITVTPPVGAAAALIGLSTDIGQTIDPETGVAVTGRKASVALTMASLTAAGLGIPRGIADTSSNPWLVRFTDVHGNPQTWKVVESVPDRAAGLVVLMLEAYRTA